MYLRIMPSFSKCTSLVKSHKAQFLDLFYLHYTLMTLLNFADDSCLILQHKNLADLNAKINTEIKAIEKYMIANKLTSNISKTNVIVINSNSKSNNLTTDVTASKLSLVQNAKYLEVSFDNCLSFKNRITLLKKVILSCRNFSQSQTISKQKSYNLYYAIFHSNLHNELIIWGSTYKSYLKKTEHLTKYSSQIVEGEKYYKRATLFYSQLKILKLVDLTRLEMALLVSKIKNKTLPAQFYNYINKVGNISKESTRANTKKNYFIPFFKKTKLQRSIKYQGLVIWSSLDSEIKNS